MNQGAVVKNAYWRESLLCALAALIVRLVYLFESGANPFRHHLDLDIGVYHNWAQSILAGNQFASGPFLQAPLFPYFLAGCYRLFGTDPAPVYWIQAIIGAVTVLLAARVAGRYWGRTGALATGLLLALYKPAVFYTGVLLVPTLATCLLATALILTPRRPLLAGILSGLTGLAHPILLPGSLIAVFAFSAGRRARLLLLAGVVFSLLPTTIYNAVQTGRFIPISANTGINFYIGNAETANGFYLPPTGMRGDEDPIGIREAGRRSGRNLSAVEASRYWLDLGLESWKNDPQRAAGLYFKKLHSALGAYEIPQIESFEFEKRYSRLLKLPLLPNWIILLTFATAALVGLRHDSRLRYLMLATLATACLIAVFFVTARFRLPLSLFLALAAGGGVAHLLPRLRSRPRPTAFQALPVILAGLATLLIFSPNWRQVAHDQSNGSYHFRLGIYAERDGQVEAAMGHYAEALAADSLYARAAINLGILSARKGDIQTAEPLLRRGVRLDPRSARGLLALGQLCQVKGDISSACDLYSRALAADSSFLRALEFLATARYANGELAEAKRHSQELINRAGANSPLARRCRLILDRAAERERHGLSPRFSSAVAQADLALAGGNLGGAAQIYQELLVSDLENPIALLELARLLAAQGQMDRAQRFLTRYLSTGGSRELATPLLQGGNQP
jgi:Tfp pilus assembly protein PilF